MAVNESPSRYAAQDRSRRSQRHADAELLRPLRAEVRERRTSRSPGNVWLRDTGASRLIVMLDRLVDLQPPKDIVVIGCASRPRLAMFKRSAA